MPRMTFASSRFRYAIPGATKLSSRSHSAGYADQIFIIGRTALQANRS